MGATYRESVALITARYDAIYKKAEAEFERYGEISDETHRALTNLELEMEIFGL